MSDTQLCFPSSSKDSKCVNMCDQNQNQLLKSYAVRVSKLQYSYLKHNAVLNECSINVPKGEIYALLGSSGCGKTTLVNCIIGRLRPQSGNIKIFGQSEHLLIRNQIGYMPQHVSLFTDFTIQQNLRYFARIYGMNDKIITIKMNELLKLLDMPDKNGIVSQLSGGQQRRVSLCVALIHSPMLVILDEPTVGVDPLLRHQMWQYLHMICKHNSVTVIITTHYIEEARNAATVAYLRDGRILVEQSPETLLNKYNCNTLENTFLMLCQNNIHDVIEENISDEYDGQSNKNISFSAIRQNEKFQQFWPLFHKNMLTFYRSHRLVSIFCIMCPAIALLLFDLVILKHPINYSLSYHNNDASHLSTDYIRLLSDKVFIKHLEHSEHSVINSVIDGKSKVGITISSNFTKDLKNIFRNRSKFTSVAFNSIKVYPEIIQITDLNIIPELSKTYMNLIQSYLSSIGLNPATAEPPFKPIVIYGSMQINVYEFAIPSFIVFGIFFGSHSIALQSIVSEKFEPVFGRSIIAGVNSFNYYFAQFIAKTIILILQVIVYLVLIYPLFESRLESNLIVIYLFLFLQGLNGITFGILFSSFISNLMLSTGVTFILLISLTTIGGCIWPLEALPQIIQYLSPYILPVILPIKSLHCILFRGWSIGYYDVWIGFVSNIIFSIIYFTIAVIYSHLILFKN